MGDVAAVRPGRVRLAGPTIRRAPGTMVGSSWLRDGLALAGLTATTHIANLAFTIAGGRLLAPGEFATLTALLGIVLVGMAPGMAVQALTAAGALGRPVVIDKALARRLAVAVAVAVLTVLVGLGRPLGIPGPTVPVVTATAAGMLVLTAANEGLLQGAARFPALGLVLVAGASVKVAVGLPGMGATHTVTVAAVAVMVGYGAQLAASRRLTGGLAPSPTRIRMSRTVATAMAATAGLLAVVHVDALLACVLLGPADAGLYAAGAAGMRIVFWAPQFAMLLLFPQLVVDPRPRVVTAAIAGLAAVGTLLVGTAWMAGPTLVALVFGPEFAPIGVDLWRFAWLGTAAVGLQVLVLADLAHDRRDTVWLLAATLLLIVTTLLVTGPTTPAGLVTPDAAIVTAAVVVGLIAHAARHDVPPHCMEPAHG